MISNVHKITQKLEKSHKQVKKGRFFPMRPLKRAYLFKNRRLLYTGLAKSNSIRLCPQDPPASEGRHFRQPRTGRQHSRMWPCSATLAHVAL